MTYISRTFDGDCLAPESSFYVSNSNGARLRIRQRGVGPATCLLIHGFADGSYVWADFMSAMAPLCRLLAVDLRGHGDSAWDAKGDYSTSTHLHDIVRAMDALDLDRCLVIGHSMGGALAIRLAAWHPSRVIGVVAVDAGPDMDPRSMAHLRAQFDASIQTYDSVSDYASWILARRPLASPEVLSRIAREALKPDARGGVRLKCDPALAKHGCLSSNDTDVNVQLWSLLAKVTCPVLIVRGAASAMLPRAVVEKMLQGLGDGRLSTVPLAGHAVMTDNPSGFADATRPFIEQLLTHGSP